MGVIAKCLMKAGGLADTPFDQIRVVRIAQRENVSFDGNEQLIGDMWKLAQDGLRTDNHKLICAGDGCRCAENVLKLTSLHARAV